MSYKKTEKYSKTFGLSSSVHRNRYRDVIKVLAKYGLDEFLVSKEGARIPFFYGKRKKDLKYTNLSRPKRIKLAIEELDGAYVKFAQILSNRPDILPEEYIQELESLQDKIPPFPTEKAIEIIESELENKLDRLFLMFDDEPLASGSIAQIHRALLFDGTPVVIKVQRPDIEEKFRIDIDILNYIAQYASKIPTLKSQFRNSNPIKALSNEIYKELDFKNELSNIKQFEKNFEGNADIYIPRSYPSYSTGKILTMEYIQGIKVTDYEKYEKLGIKPADIANKLIDLGLIQLFDFRTFHADPHPGNILVLKDGRICLLDFGLVGKISSRQRQNIIDLIIAFSKNDSKKITRLVTKYTPKEVYVNEEELQNKISNLLDKYYDKNLKEIKIGEALSEILTIILDYKINLNFNIYLLIKALSSYEGIGKKISPEFELAPHAHKVRDRLIREQLSPEKIIKEAYYSVTDTVDLLTSLPSDIKELLTILQAGRLKANISILDLKETIDYVFGRLDRIVNRVVMAIILAAIIMGSSIILRTAPNLDSRIIFVSAAIGFVLSLIMAFILLISIVRNKGT